MIFVTIYGQYWRWSPNIRKNEFKRRSSLNRGYRKRKLVTFINRARITMNNFIKIPR